MPRFERCDVVGFDSVRAPGRTKHDLVDFVIIASDHEVAIIHLSLMSPLGLNTGQPCANVSSNPQILKVGANVEYQRPILSYGPGIEFQGVLDLRDRMDDYSDSFAESFQDHNGQALSSMTARIFGSHFPTCALQSTFKDSRACFSRASDQVN